MGFKMSGHLVSKTISSNRCEAEETALGCKADEMHAWDRSTESSQCRQRRDSEEGNAVRTAGRGSQEAREMHPTGLLPPDTTTSCLPPTD